MQVSFLVTLATACLLLPYVNAHESPCKCSMPRHIAGDIVFFNDGVANGNFYIDFEEKLYITNVTVDEEDTSIVAFVDYIQNTTVSMRVSRIKSKRLCSVEPGYGANAFKYERPPRCIPWVDMSNVTSYRFNDVRMNGDDDNTCIPTSIDEFHGRSEPLVNLVNIVQAEEPESLRRIFSQYYSESGCPVGYLLG